MEMDSDVKSLFSGCIIIVLHILIKRIKGMKIRSKKPSLLLCICYRSSLIKK